MNQTVTKSEILKLLSLPAKERVSYVDLLGVSKKLGVELSSLPFSIRILLANITEAYLSGFATEEHLKAVANWKPNVDNKSVFSSSLPFMPSRVLLQDLTGVPVVTDFGAMREACLKAGADPTIINPLVPIDLVVDHSVQVDHYGSKDAMEKNIAIEYRRNEERYKLLKWAQKSYKNFTIVPPGRGIVHQVNIEYLSSVVQVKKAKQNLAVFDTCVGTDSHTTMVNGIGVLGWGVGGIEAEAVALGQPYFMPLPKVVGVKLIGSLKEGVTATDLVIYITQKLREKKVVGSFVEFFGKGAANLDATDRTTISNMSPEFGSTVAFFPADENTLDYLKRTGRSEEKIDLVRAYLNKTGTWNDNLSEPNYSSVLEIELNEVSPSVAGPNRPEQRLDLSLAKESFDAHFGLKKDEGAKKESLPESRPSPVDGDIVIAAITSCTNTSNPYVMVGAGLLARNAIDKGLCSKPWVKTSLAPGSQAVTQYLEKAGLTPLLAKLGFNVVGYGCTTCIGNSGPLHSDIEEKIEKEKLNVVAVLSGNRNFEGRIHRLVRASYLASPMLVVAYALAGSIKVDLTKEPLGYTTKKEPVFLKDIWPSAEEINETIKRVISKETYLDNYADVFEGDQNWQNLSVNETALYEWDQNSSYVKCPPFLGNFGATSVHKKPIVGARVLVKLGDFVTTDHISPAGSIPKDSPAGKYLANMGVSLAQFNTFGARRGNHEVMLRGTFGNIRLKNLLLDDQKEGDFTTHYPSRETMRIYDASVKYKQSKTPLIVLAGKSYGTGSSRDWAAKGPALLGVQVVIAEGYERIHRSNLIGMGILPLEYLDAQNHQSLGLKGDETYAVDVPKTVTPRSKITVKAENKDGKRVVFQTLVRLDSNIECDYFMQGGILPYVLQKVLKK